MRSPACRARTMAAAAWVSLIVAPPVLAQAAGGIYTCDYNGKKLTSDRPIPQCIDREQRILNSDGSTRERIPPTPTADERSAIEAKQAQEVLERENRREAVRRDRNLLQRFPTEAVHNKAREAALDDIRKSLRTSETRLAKLEQERKPLLDETEFYVGKPLPPKLKQQIEANEATTAAQRSLVLNQQAEIVRINNLYDVELERLRKLWAGAPAGSMGVLPVPAPASAASAALRRPAP